MGAWVLVGACPHHTSQRALSKVLDTCSEVVLFGFGLILPVWEVHFHPSNPDHLFTCSEDGSLWHWDASTDISEKPSFLHQGKDV